MTTLTFLLLAMEATVPVAPRLVIHGRDSMWVARIEDGHGVLVRQAVHPSLEGALHMLATAVVASAPEPFHRAVVALRVILSGGTP